MPSLPVLSLSCWNAWLCLLLGTALNGLLLMVARRHTMGELRDYRRCVIFFCYLNILFLFLQALTQPVFFVSENLVAYIFIQGWAAQIPSLQARVVLMQFFFMIMFSVMTSSGWHFLSRWLVICRQYKGMLGQKLLLVLASFIYHLPSAITMLFSMLPSDEKSITTLLGGIEDGGEDWSGTRIALEMNMSNPVTRYGTVWVIVGIVGCYVLVIFCYLQIRAFLKRHLLEDANCRKRDMIRQISKNMIFQACLPLCCLSISIFCLLAMLSQQYSARLLQLELLSFLPLNWLPMLNPLVATLTIREYRIGALRLLVRKKKKQSSDKVLQIGSKPKEMENKRFFTNRQ